MKFEKGLVSVLITNYNHANYIKDCIRSLNLSTYKNKEIIIVDDGSTNNSREVIKELKGKYGLFFKGFKTIFLDKNLGINGALNQGILHVNGEMVIILDADDMVSKDYIKTLVFELLKGKENLGFVYSDCVLIDKNSKIIGKGKSNKFDSELLKNNSYIPVCGLTWTNVLLIAFPVDEKIKVATKVYRWRAIVNKGFVGKHLPKPLFFYRMHETNVSGIGNKVISELNNPKESSLKILSGYWQSEDEK